MVHYIHHGCYLLAADNDFFIFLSIQMRISLIYVKCFFAFFINLLYCNRHFRTGAGHDGGHAPEDQLIIIEYCSSNDSCGWAPIRHLLKIEVGAVRDVELPFHGLCSPPIQFVFIKVINQVLTDTRELLPIQSHIIQPLYHTGLTALRLSTLEGFCASCTL